MPAFSSNNTTKDKVQVSMHAGIQKMNEYPRLEDIFRQIKCSKEFQDTVDEILTVENEVSTPMRGHNSYGGGI